MITNDTKVVKDQASEKKVEVKPAEAVEKKSENAQAPEVAKKNAY